MRASPREIDGATVYANNCSRCHEYRSPTEYNGPQWAIITTHMRVVGGIPADESRAVFEYLKAQHHPPYIAPAVPIRTPSSVDAAQGKTLVQQRGCIGRHVVEGRGGTMGPPWTASRIDAPERSSCSSYAIRGRTIPLA